MTSSRPLDWIQEIEASIAELDERPQFGIAAPLDWAKLEEGLKKTLSPEATLTHTTKGWLDASQVLGGFGEKILALAINWSPLLTSAYFVTESENLKELMAEIFRSDELSSYFFDSSYATGFFHYLAAEVLRLIENQSFASPLTPRLGSEIEDMKESIGDQPCFAIDISVGLAGKNFWGRVLLPEPFRREWKTYFAHLPPPPLSQKMKEKLHVELSLEVAHTLLRFDEWKKVKNGDFIVLDHCSYDPVEHKGGVVLSLKQKPIFRGRLKDGEIKITNYPLYEEVSDAMEDEPLNRHFDSDEEDEDEDLYGDLEDEDSEFDEDEEDIFAGLEPRKERAKEEEEKKPVASLKLTGAPEAPTAITPEELPIHLTVEVGRVKMSAGALMNLSPGNLLELNVTPEQGVDLVINGKKVGRGELIRIGDILGVRILEL